MGLDAEKPGSDLPFAVELTGYHWTSHPSLTFLSRITGKPKVKLQPMSVVFKLDPKSMRLGDRLPILTPPRSSSAHSYHLHFLLHLLSSQQSCEVGA